MANLQGKYWCFTIPNPTQDPDPRTFGRPLKLMVYQHEIGEEGLLHIQGYCRFDTNKRRTTLAKYFAPDIPHLETRVGSESQAIAYCTKDDTRDPDFDIQYWPDQITVEVARDQPSRAPAPPGQGRRNDIHACTDIIKAGGSLKRVAEEHAASYVRYHRGFKAYKTELCLVDRNRRDITVIYICGPPGTGKTYWCQENYPENDNNYWKTEGKWWDHYDGHEVVVLNDFTDSWMTVSGLKRMLDTGAVQIETKGQPALWLTATTFIFTSNRKPQNLYRKKFKNLRWEPGSNPLYRRFPVIRLFNEQYVPMDEEGDELVFIDEAADWDDGYDDPEDEAGGFIGSDGVFRRN